MLPLSPMVHPTALRVLMHVQHHGDIPCPPVFRTWYHPGRSQVWGIAQKLKKGSKKSQALEGHRRRGE